MEPGWYTHELCHHLPTNDATNRGLPMWRCSSSSKGTYSHYYCISWNWRLSLCCTTYLNPELHHQAPDHTDSCWKTPQKKTIWRIASLLIMCICSKCGTINIAWFKPSNVLPNDHSICGPLDRPVVSGRPAAKTKLRPEHCWGHPRHRHPKVHQRKGVRKFVTS
jgi:hypothetical protein